ncbi:MAG: Tryptophan synthase alpha chain, partial [uncultured Thermomicrobiales bacterium]
DRARHDLTRRIPVDRDRRDVRAGPVRGPDGAPAVHHGGLPRPGHQRGDRDGPGRGGRGRDGDRRAVLRPARRREYRPAHRPGGAGAGHAAGRLPGARPAVAVARRDDPAGPDGLHQPVLPVRLRPAGRRRGRDRCRWLHRPGSPGRGERPVPGGLPGARPRPDLPRRPDQHRRATPADRRAGFRLRLLRLADRGDGRPQRHGRRPARVHRPGPRHDRPAAGRRLRDLDRRARRHGRQARRRRDHRLGHDQRHRGPPAGRTARRRRRVHAQPSVV